MNVSLSHTLPDTTNGHVAEVIFLSSRVSLHAFLVRSSCGEYVTCQEIRSTSGLIRGQILDIFKTLNRCHRIKCPVVERYLCVGMQFVRF